MYLIHFYIICAQNAKFKNQNSYPQARVSLSLVRIQHLWLLSNVTDALPELVFYVYQDKNNMEKRQLNSNLWIKCPDGTKHESKYALYNTICFILARNKTDARAAMHLSLRLRPFGQSIIMFCSRIASIWEQWRRGKLCNAQIHSINTRQDYRLVVFLLARMDKILWIDKKEYGQQSSINKKKQ